MGIKHSRPVPPFIRYCSAIIPTMFDDSLSYYEALCALNRFIQKNLVEVINNNATVTQEYIDLTNQLKEYVENYFENLDVQEEINNKLDQMAEDGTLQALIMNYLELNPLITFETLTEAQASDQLIEGAKFKTLGKVTLNDGYGAYYICVTTDTGIALQNDLYAELIPNFGGDNYIEEITITEGRIHNTNYRYATIPLNDNDGNLIEPSVNEVEEGTLTPLQYADANFTTLTTNAGLARLDSTDHWKQGAIISNGVALHNDLCDVTPQPYMRYIGFKADRSVVDFPAIGTTTDIMLAQGVVNAFLVFNKSIDNGIITIPEGLDEDDTSPRMDIGVKLDGTLIILASDGRTVNNVGLTMQESAELLLSLGCVNAWRCDGGGSTSMTYKGSKQNLNIDGDGTIDRIIWVTLNFKKQTIDKQLAEVYSFIGKERQLLNKQIREDADEAYEHARSKICLFNWSSGYNNPSNDGEYFGLQFQDALKHDYHDKFEFVKDENTNRVIGFKVNFAGLVRVTLNAGISCIQKNGNRALSIQSPLGTNINYRCFMPSYFAPSSNSEVHELTLSVVFNNTTSGTTYYLSGYGYINGTWKDDYSRLYATIEEFGYPN